MTMMKRCTMIPTTMCTPMPLPTTTMMFITMIIIMKQVIIMILTIPTTIVIILTRKCTRTKHLLPTIITITAVLQMPQKFITITIEREPMTRTIIIIIDTTARRMK